MSKKTISTPDIFSEHGESRGVSEVVGTASLIVLALGLVGGLSVGLGGFTDGIDNNDLEGDISFNQDGEQVTMTVDSISDSTDQLRFATGGDGEFNNGTVSGQAPVTLGDANSDPDPVVGTVVTGGVDGNADFAEGDTITVTALDDDGNSRVIAEFTFGSVA